MDLTLAGLLLMILWIGYGLMQFLGELLAVHLGERIILRVSVLVIATGTVLIILSLSMPLFFWDAPRRRWGWTLRDDACDRSGGRLSALCRHGHRNQSGGRKHRHFIVANRCRPPHGVVLLALGIRSADTNVPSDGSRTLDDRPLINVSVPVQWLGGPISTSRYGCSPSTIYGVHHVQYVVYLVRLPDVHQLLSNVPNHRESYQRESGCDVSRRILRRGILVQPLAGDASVRIGPRRTLTVFLSVTVCSFMALPYADGQTVILALSVLLSSLLAFWPVASTYVVKTVTGEHQGSVIGIIRTIYLTLAAVGPVFAGHLADRAMFDAVFFTIAGMTFSAELIWAQVSNR